MSMVVWRSFQYFKPDDTFTIICAWLQHIYGGVKVIPILLTWWHFYYIICALTSTCLWWCEGHSNTFNLMKLYIICALTSTLLLLLVVWRSFQYFQPDGTFTIMIYALTCNTSMVVWRSFQYFRPDGPFYHIICALTSTCLWWCEGHSNTSNLMALLQYNLCFDLFLYHTSNLMELLLVNPCFDFNRSVAVYRSFQYFQHILKRKSMLPKFQPPKDYNSAPEMHSA